MDEIVSDISPIGYRCWAKDSGGTYRIWFSNKPDDDGFELSGNEAIYTENQIKDLLAAAHQQGMEEERERCVKICDGVYENTPHGVVAISVKRRIIEGDGNG